MKFLLPILGAYVAFAAFSSSKAPLGTYSGASETHSTVAFELKPDGKAVVTTEYYDGEGDPKKVIDKKVKGSWAYAEPLLTIRFGAYRDTFRAKADCAGAEGHPCFVFEKSRGKQNSPLAVSFDFINYDAPNR